MIVRTARSAAALAVATLLAAVTALLVLPGIAHAKDLNCRDFTYQEDAQAYLDAHPGDPDNLDSNGDGVACETLPRRLLGRSDDGDDDHHDDPDGDDDLRDGRSRGLHATDDDHDVDHQEHDRPHHDDEHDHHDDLRADSDSGSNSDSDSDSDADDDSSSSGTSGDDRDCADFASQADAQAALDADLSDPDNLDADVDGIACEDHFGDAGQQVQVHPSGGVDTGGGPADA